MNYSILDKFNNIFNLKSNPRGSDSLVPKKIIASSYFIRISFTHCISNNFRRDGCLSSTGGVQRHNINVYIMAMYGYNIDRLFHRDYCRIFLSAY